MASLPYFSNNPERQAPAFEQWALQSQREAPSTVGAVRVSYDLLKRKETRVAGLLLLGAALVSCIRPASSGVIPTGEASDTPSPSGTPTGTAEPTGTHTATPSLTPTPPPTTEHLVIPSTATAEHATQTPFPDADGDGFPDFPNPDLNGDGRIDEREMAADVAAVTQWFKTAAQTFAEGKGAPLVVETIAHFFGHSATTLRAEGTIDLQWVPDSALDLNDPTVANGLGAHDGVGILTTGAHLSEVMSRLALQLAPNHEASAFTRVLSGLTDQLGLENLWRPGLSANLTDEIGLKGDMCVVTDKGSDAQSGVAERNPVVVQTGIEVSEEFQDQQDRWHVSPDSLMGVVARLVRNAELPELQQLWHVNGEAVEVTQVTLEHSIAMQVHLVGKNVDGQLVSCGRPEQGGAQGAATQTLMVVPTASETPWPQGGPGPGPDQPSPTRIPPPTIETPSPGSTNTPVVPSATPRPSETPVPTNTPVGPTATEASPPPTDTAVPPTAEPTEVPVTIIPPEKTLPFDTPIPPTVQTSPTPLR